MCTRMNSLNLHKVTKSFLFENKKINVLDNINYNFISNKTAGILGVSGTGKSTLLNIILGIEELSSGEILFNNKNYNNNNNLINLITQQAYLINELTVLENIMLANLALPNSNLNKLELDKLKSKSLGLLKKVDLFNKENTYPSLLSGGELQRVSIARALINNPKFLLADEPTGNLDQKTSEKVFDLLINLQKDFNMGLIICTHNKSMAKKLDINLVLSKGKLQHD